MKVEVISKFNVCIDTTKGKVLKPKEVAEVVPSNRIKYLLNNKFLKVVNMPTEAKQKTESIKKPDKIEPVKVTTDNEEKPYKFPRPKYEKKSGRKKKKNPFSMEAE